MKTLFISVVALPLFFCPFALQVEDIELMPQEEIPETPPQPYQMSDKSVRYLQIEGIYQGSLSWQGNKVSTKFN